MMRTLLPVYILWCVTPAQPLSYPVFGTKRYHRASNGAGAVSSSEYTSNPYYHQYYEQQQVPYHSPNYDQNGYVSKNGFYYYPRHEYQTYGLPTYRGEYKPSPYYYAPGPSYNYYDDREIASNPLDDLHEEMLQEDELERQRERYPHGQESWYDNPRQKDELTNNFLKNLIAYNTQVNVQQRQQEQQQKQQELLQHQIQQEQAFEYDEYPETDGMEYEYEPHDENLYDAEKYETTQRQHKIQETEDENERQLKSLAHGSQSNNQINQNHNQNNRHENNYNNWQNPGSSYAQYDTDPEYDDTWINWDRKRSRPNTFSIKRDEPIKDFNDRKPYPVVKHFETTTISETTTSTTKSPPLSATTTALSAEANQKKLGQKEIVLLRPAAPAQHIFAKPVLAIIDNAIKNGKENSEDKNKRPKEEKLTNIYDTIKELLTMQEHLQGKNLGNSKFQKRFVSSEESLVHELENLKRRSV